jgi:membrane-bound metal-dependent hydrolase YbcI (DUF457 family)
MRRPPKRRVRPTAQASPDVDPVSHVLFGAVAVTAARPRALRPLVLTAVAASLVPDVDAMVMPAGWDRYLIVHEIGTHSLLGAAAVAVLVAVLVRRWVAAPFWITGAAALAGSLGHVFWDTVSGAEIRLFWPLASGRAGGHLVAMADPFVLGGLSCGAAGVAVWRGRAQAIAAATLLMLAGFLCAKLLLQQAAFAVYDAAAAHRGEAVTAITQDARWGSLTSWWVYDATAERLRAWQVDGLTGGATLLFERVRAPGDQRVEASRSAPAVRHALALFDLAFAETWHSTGGGYEVRWSDIRFCHADGRCDLWFCAAYAADGAPVQQVVRVGRLVQTRPFPRR